MAWARGWLPGLVLLVSCASRQAAERCTLRRLALEDPLPTPLDRPVVFEAPGGSLRNSKITGLMAREAMVSRMGDEDVHLTSSNTFSEGHFVMPLREYVAYLSSCVVELDAGASSAPGGAGSNGAAEGTCPVLANETLYLFGENYTPSWEALAETYAVPPCRTCAGENIAVSLGIGGAQSGVSWHMHGPGFSEVFHGGKRWFLLPPDSPIPSSFDPNQSVSAWTQQVLPLYSASTPELEDCTIVPGQVLYFPDGWHHATLNLGPYTTFASTFLREE